MKNMDLSILHWRRKWQGGNGAVSWTTVHGVSKSWTQLKWWSIHTSYIIEVSVFPCETWNSLHNTSEIWTPIFCMQYEILCDIWKSLINFPIGSIEHYVYHIWKRGCQLSHMQFGILYISDIKICAHILSPQMLCRSWRSRAKNMKARSPEWLAHTGEAGGTGGPAAAAELCEWERWQGLCWVQGVEPSEEEESLGSEQHHHPGHCWLLGQSCILTAAPWGWPVRRRRKSRSWRSGGDEDTGKVRKAKGSGGCWSGRLQRHGENRALAGPPYM